MTDESGATVTALTLRAGDEKRLNVRILPAAASQEYTADITDKTIATIKQ